MDVALAERVEPLKAPFPYFGGKRSVASEIWTRFGNPANYVEPFFGSGAVLLARPSIPKVETVNDANGFLCVAPATIRSAIQRAGRFVSEGGRWFPRNH